MRAAMADAEVGDDVYGEDPTVNALEQRVAALLGHEAGLFVPSGSLGNQLGLRLLCPPGQEIVCDTLAHIARAELGAAAVLSGHHLPHLAEPSAGCSTPTRSRALDRARRRALPGLDRRDRGREHAQLRRRHRAAGRPGRRGAELARDHGLGLHLDGARLWNAHVATGDAAGRAGRRRSTPCRCACPRGSARRSGRCSCRVPSASPNARVWRKRYGGGMRQVGILAAAGLYALDHNLERLADDHARARRLAEALGVDAATVDTNIVVVDVAGRRSASRRGPPTQGVLVSALGPALPAPGHAPRHRRRRHERAIDVLAPLVGTRA